MSSSSSRRRNLRAFVKWMEASGIQYSDALEFVMDEERIVSDGVGVKALYDLKEGDLIATIPKEACLTIRTTGAVEAIEGAQLAGPLGLSVAIMCEHSLGEESSWYPYLNLIPAREAALPIVWENHEIDRLLKGTELHSVILEDKKLIEEDWKECVWPLCETNPQMFPVQHFTLEDYFSAKTLIASRSFEVDEFHGIGMVPLADLFNHKTAAEDVHISSIDKDDGSDCTVDEEDGDCQMSEGTKTVKKCESKGELSSEHASVSSGSEDEGTSEKVPEISEQIKPSECNGNSSVGDSDGSSESEAEESDVLDMILVKNVASGSEIFNTYGTLSNAALLHRYGFTEPDNPFDIVNIEYDLVLDYCNQHFSDRHMRNCVRLWKKYGCTACSSQDCEYFEISASGKPQLELVFLLYVAHLCCDDFDALDLTFHKLETNESSQWTDKVIATIFEMEVNSKQHTKSPLLKGKARHIPTNAKQEIPDLNDELLTKDVGKSLLWLCDRRDEAYGSTSLEEDLKILESGRVSKLSKEFHALSLKVSERSILDKLRILVCQKHKELKKV